MRPLGWLLVLVAMASTAPAVRAQDDEPPPSLLIVEGDEVTVEGPLNIDGSIAVGPRLALLLGQSEAQREAWAPLYGRRVRARGKIMTGAQRRAARYVVRYRTTHLEAIDEPVTNAYPAPWPRVAARVIVRGVLDDKGRVMLAKKVGFCLLLPRESTLARCAGRRVELTGEVLGDHPWERDGARLFVLDTSYAKLEEEEQPAAGEGAPPATRGIVDGVSGR